MFLTLLSTGGRDEVCIQGEKVLVHMYRSRANPAPFTQTTEGSAPYEHSKARCSQLSTVLSCGSQSRLSP